MSTFLWCLDFPLWWSLGWQEAWSLQRGCDRMRADNASHGYFWDYWDRSASGQPLRITYITTNEFNKKVDFVNGAVWLSGAAQHWIWRLRPCLQLPQSKKCFSQGHHVPGAVGTEHLCPLSIVTHELVLQAMTMENPMSVTLIMQLIMAGIQWAISLESRA